MARQRGGSNKASGRGQSSGAGTGAGRGDAADEMDPPPRVLRKAPQDEIDVFIEMCAEFPASEISAIIAKRVLTLEQLRSYGPAAVYKWQQFCRRKGVPGFGRGENIEDAFPRARGASAVKSDVTALLANSASAAGSSASQSQKVGAPKEKESGHASLPLEKPNVSAAPPYKTGPDGSLRRDMIDGKDRMNTAGALAATQPETRASTEICDSTTAPRDDARRYHHLIGKHLIHLLDARAGLQ
ncbi:hypothetical protein FVE85_3651 [Porphyridium purpureum]|uniref:Uncharacterized protein n=1 Tax=Porphyridium purpureum TaxID=35688 RepID=A0A5J4YND9_PORPP|nr:hypothetical protein FVE85_3651 [Porphyridium purpureum]|eukprot:POR0944..scf249_10